MPTKNNLGYRLYSYLRKMSCPFEKIAGVVPAQGRILDLGCGFGILSLLLSLSSVKRDLTGIDSQADRVGIAAEEARRAGLSNCSFFTGDIIDCDYAGIYDCILLVDVLYQLAIEDKIKVVGRCRDSLAAGGSLIIKEMNDHPLWKLIWCRLQEGFLARPLRLNRRRIDFSGQAELTEIFRDAGFDVEKVNMDKGYAYPHILFICRKQRR